MAGSRRKGKFLGKFLGLVDLFHQLNKQQLMEGLARRDLGIKNILSVVLG